jgi:hypothetical protein
MTGFADGLGARRGPVGLSRESNARERQAMAVYEVIPSSETADAPAGSPSLQGGNLWLLSLWNWVTSRLSVCADYYEAATLYEEFNALSDAELARRGLGRATLARDVCQACDRDGDQSQN